MNESLIGVIGCDRCKNAHHTVAHCRFDKHHDGPNWDDVADAKGSQGDQSDQAVSSTGRVIKRKQAGFPEPVPVQPQQEVSPVAKVVKHQGDPAVRAAELDFRLHSAVSVLWGKTARFDAIVTEIDFTKGLRPVQVRFETDGNSAWVAISHVKVHADAEPESVPEGTQVGCTVEAQDPHDQQDPDAWHRGLVESVKQTKKSGEASGLLFWVKFEGTGFYEWCRVRHVRKTSKDSAAKPAVSKGRKEAASAKASRGKVDDAGQRLRACLK